MEQDDRVERIAQNVLRRLEGATASSTAAESRSTMGLFGSQATPTPSASSSRSTHPADTVFPEPEYVGDILQFLGAKRCVIEPDKPCINSGRCKNLGP